MRGGEGFGGRDIQGAAYVGAEATGNRRGTFLELGLDGLEERGGQVAAIDGRRQERRGGGEVGIGGGRGGDGMGGEKADEGAAGNLAGVGAARDETGRHVDVGMGFAGRGDERGRGGEAEDDLGTVRE